MTSGGSTSFDRAAAYYDETRGLTDDAVREQTSLLAGELHGRGATLEIGVGTGQVALPLADVGIPIVGVDISEPMLRVLLEKAGSSRFPSTIRRFDRGAVRARARGRAPRVGSLRHQRQAAPWAQRSSASRP